MGKPHKIRNQKNSRIQYPMHRANVMKVEVTEMTECNITEQEAAQRDQRPPQEEQEATQKDQRPPQDEQEAAQKDQHPLQDEQEAAQKDQRPPSTEKQEADQKDQHPPQDEQEAAQKDQRPLQEGRNPIDLPDIQKSRYEITECEAYGFLRSGDQNQ